MSKTLRWLIEASGGDPIAGDSFRYDVTDAGNAVKMTDYVLLNAGQPTDDWYSSDETEYKYPSGTQFHPTADFAFTTTGPGSRHHHIRTNTWSPSSCPEVTVNGTSWNDSTGVVTLTITIDVDTPPATPTLNAVMFWFTEYSPFNAPPDTSSHPVDLIISATGGGSPDTVVVTPAFTWQPDGGAFNDQKTVTFGPVAMITTYPTWSNLYEWETHDSSAYTNVVTHYIDSYVDTTYSVWFRYRLKAEYNGGVAGSWVNVGEVAWTDPRPDV